MPSPPPGQSSFSVEWLCDCLLGRVVRRTDAHFLDNRGHQNSPKHNGHLRQVCSFPSTGFSFYPRAQPTVNQRVTWKETRKGVKYSPAIKWLRLLGGGGRGGSRQPVHACHRAVQPRPSSESKIVCGRRLVRQWNKDIEGRDSHLLKITIDQEEKKQPDVPGSVVINNGGPHWAMCPAAKSVPQSQHAPSVRPGIASQKSSGHLGALVDDGPSRPGTQAAGDCPSPKAVFPKGLGSRPSQHPSGLAGCSLS